MKKDSLEPGDVVSFRIPIGIKDEVLKRLNEQRRQHGRAATKYYAGLFFDRIEQDLRLQQSWVSLPMPAPLTTEEQSMLSDSHVQRIAGRWVYQLIRGEWPLGENSPVLHGDHMPHGDHNDSSKNSSESIKPTPPQLQNLRNHLYQD